MQDLRDDVEILVNIVELLFAESKTFDGRDELILGVVLVLLDQIEQLLDNNRVDILFHALLFVHGFSLFFEHFLPQSVLLFLRSFENALECLLFHVRLLLLTLTFDCLFDDIDEIFLVDLVQKDFKWLLCRNLVVNDIFIARHVGNLVVSSIETLHLAENSLLVDFFFDGIHADLR